MPWAVDPTLRMNPHNGICLCALHDRAFDLGILSIGADLRVAAGADLATRHAGPVANHMRAGDERAVRDHGPAGDDGPAAKRFLWAFVGKKMRPPTRWPPDPALFQRQRAWVGARLESRL